jgi:uncharacterized integral membrane protein
MMRKLRFAIAAIAALLLLSFIFQNHANVPVKFWPFLQVQAPLWLIMAACAGLGVLAFHFFQAFKRSKKTE